MKLTFFKLLLTISLLLAPSLLLAHDIGYLNEAVSNTLEGIAKGRAGDVDDMTEYLQNARDYAISAQSIQKNRHINIAIHHLKSAINHAQFNNINRATKDAGLALLHLNYVNK